MTVKLSARLKRVMLTGSLTVADLSHWLNRPYPTVRTWVSGERAPVGDTVAALVYKRVALLEGWLRTGARVPEMSAHKRPEHLKQVRNALENGGVSARDPA